MLRSWRTCFVQFVSLGNRYGDVFISRSISWGIRILTFVMISNNSEGICKRIRRSLLGLASQPSASLIDMLGCGHFGGVFDKVLPVWWDGACLHVRHGTKLTVKDYVVLWTDATCGGIPYKWDAPNMEGVVSKIRSNTVTWLPFWWTCSHRVLEPSI